MMKTRSCSKTGSTSHYTFGAKFDVFLSFRGPDTRANFTDSLYHALLDKGIHVFIDKKGIDIGEEIGLEILQAINDSKICIPIFSKSYASSSWCLRELKHMMERRKTNELEVLPIFYDVTPADVKLETDVYRYQLTQHKPKHETEIVRLWRKALKEAAKIKGWDTKDIGHGELTRLIARKLLVKLKVSPIHLSDDLIGVDQSMDAIIDLLSVESEDIRLIGIWGMGGIGKTTLAKVIYHKLSTNFESCSFISDVRQASESSNSGLLSLQRQLVHDILQEKSIEIFSIDQGINMIKERFKRTKVLIFLDDVNHRSQLMALAAKREWFGSGSRIVVTTRDKDVLSKFLDQFDHGLTYEVAELNSEESLQLFSKHAFRMNIPPSDFLSLSKNVTAKTGGLPLTIEVMGSFLYQKGKATWEDTFKKMERHLHEDVEKKLMLSYEALDEEKKQLFLDIACFLNGENKRDATYIWDDCGLFPDEGIDVLLLMSLVKVGVKNELWMHDQLKDLGKGIVRNENCKDSGKRSRVWNHEEALDMMIRKKGTETIEAICANFDGVLLTPEEFTKVPNIRFLAMINGNLSGNFKDLFPELRWLSWKNCPLYLQATNFCPKNLLILDLSRTQMTEDWNGWIQLQVATRLKVLNMSNCLGLSTTPDLSAFTSLEKLILEGCRNLLLIDRSIGHLKCLKHLNLNACFLLQKLPVELGSLEALTELLIDNYVFSGSINQVPIKALVNLECLVVCGFPRLRTLPNSIGILKFLAKLDVSYTAIEELPKTIVYLHSLKVLKMNGSNMKKLPETIGSLEKLEEIYGEDCLRLTIIPSDISGLPSLKILKLTETCVEDVPKLPQSLVSLCLSSRATNKAPKISNLVNLKNLELFFFSNEFTFLGSKGNYDRFTFLGSKSNPYGSRVTVLGSKSDPDRFAFLGSKSNPEKFVRPKTVIDPYLLPKVGTYSPYCILGLPNITNMSSYLSCLCCLKELQLINCKNLYQIGQLPSSLRNLTVRNCNLLEVVDLSDLENLRVLLITNCPLLQTLSNLSNSTNLKDFAVWDCPKLVEIQGVDALESLENLAIETAVPYQAYLIDPT
ncbi:disease resistance protein RPV1-like isoform X1 [Eucalyptus grandis]|uniref:disease resistance protein RPV1-like isoform X1 n=2 Tax=Eucalyptus grandis TaxID=71139 RepID=UPI00192EACE0|nr:disease resistance protein RPV1-like isoform X1 [Eucalyptus grandis]XP_039164219.1 disease resistance protein RPV1-like isoform X1 [Eucalyptus grandis]